MCWFRGISHSITSEHSVHVLIMRRPHLAIVVSIVTAATALYHNEFMFDERLNERRDKVCRRSLQDPTKSSLQHLLATKSDSAYLRFLGVDVELFNYILGPFSDIFYSHVYCPKTYSLRPNRPTRGQQHRGGARNVDSKLCLAITLLWYRSSSQQHLLSLVSGTVPSCTSWYLSFGNLILQKIWPNIPEARVTFPQPADITTFSKIIATQYPSLPGAFAMVDGLKLMIHTSGDKVTDNAYYNGWTCDHYVSSLFMFVPDGTIAYCVLNCPGSWHDSFVAHIGKFYDTILSNVPGGFFVVADSAFPVSKELCNVIKRPPKSNEKYTKSAMGLSDRQVADLISIRQGSEWGMRALQGAFPRLTARFIWETRGVRGVVLHNIVHLFNLRTRKIGFNQIRTLWMPAYSHGSPDLCEALSQMF